MEELRRCTIRGQARVRSLAWGADGRLVDWAAGGVTYRLDGALERTGVEPAYPFDAAVSLPGGHWSVVYEELGTKALLLQDGEVRRELDRSYYHAHLFRYPVALGVAEGAEPFLVHCPEEYSRLEVEGLADGRRRTARHGAPEDFFHSRLEVSRDGRWLLSAGWAWHPLDDVRVFDLQEALRRPESLDGFGLFAPWFLGCELSSATFGEGVLIVEAAPERIGRIGPVGREGAGPARGASGGLRPGQIGVVDLPSGRLLSAATLEERAGRMMALGDGYALGFFRYPKLIELETGRVLRRWPELSSGRETSARRERSSAAPPLALDPEHGRFALAEGEAIHVVELERPAPRPAASWSTLSTG